MVQNMSMIKWIKRAVIVVAVIAVGYFIVVYPDQSAGVVSNVFHAVRSAAVWVYDFVRNIG